MSFVCVQLMLSIISLLASAWVIGRLAPEKPWRRGALRVRCCLVLGMTLTDFCYSIIHLTAAVIVLADLNPPNAAFCLWMGPVMYFVIFSMYISIASLAHYSFLRLNSRTSERMQILNRYIIGWFLSGTALTGAVVAFVGEFEFSSGYCHAPQGNLASQLFVVITQFMCYVFVAVVMAVMAVRARSSHSDLVIRRQRGLVSGYITVTIVIGVCQLIKSVWYYSSHNAIDVVIKAYILLNLLWPTANCCVFILSTRRSKFKLNSEQRLRSVGFCTTEAGCPDGSPLHLDDKDSTGWRANTQKQIVTSRAEISTSLQGVISNLLPIGSSSIARQYARKIVKQAGSAHALALISSPKALKRVVRALWRSSHDETTPMPNALMENAVYSPSGNYTSMDAAGDAGQWRMLDNELEAESEEQVSQGMAQSSVSVPEFSSESDSDCSDGEDSTFVDCATLPNNPGKDRDSDNDNSASLIASTTVDTN